MIKEILVEKYRPTSLDEVVFADDSVKVKFQEIIDKQSTGHLLLSGPAGTGKTTCAKIIGQALSEDILYLNASDENNIDTVRTKIKDFCTCMGMSEVKVAILDECDFMTANAQAALRNIMEEYHKFTRFILTANYPNKIIDPIRSRCQQFKFAGPSKKKVGLRVAQILKKEEVTFTPKKIVPFLNACGGDIRLTINTIQKHIVDGTLTDFTSLNEDREGLLDLICNKKFTVFRQEFLNQNGDIVEFYKYIFNKAKVIDDKKWVEIMILVSEYTYRHALAPDPHINLFGCILEIIKILPRRG